MELELCHLHFQWYHNIQFIIVYFEMLVKLVIRFEVMDQISFYSLLDYARFYASGKKNLAGVCMFYCVY